MSISKYALQVAELCKALETMWLIFIARLDSYG